MCLDRTYAIHTPGRSLWFASVVARLTLYRDMGLRLFRQHVLEDTSVKELLCAGLIELILLERKGDAVNRSLLYNLIHMTIDVKMYDTDFQAAFLRVNIIF